MPKQPNDQQGKRPTGEGRNALDSTDMPLRAEDAQPDERTLEGAAAEEQRRAREGGEERSSK